MSITMFEALILAVIQGLTEWLPVSSSGHLAVSYMIMGVNPPLMFSLALHVGTLCAVLFVLRDDIRRIARVFPRVLLDLIRLRPPPLEEKDSRITMYLILATIPVAVAGFFLKSHAEYAYSSVFLLSGAFVLTGAVLLTTWGLKPSGEENTRRCMWVGFAQILTIYPGVSRSGLTISAGLHSGLIRREAARFSLLLSIPIILGSAAYEAYSSPSLAMEPYMFAGAFVSFLVGIFSLRSLINVVSQGRFYLFAPYCFSMGLGLLAWSML